MPIKSEKTTREQLLKYADLVGARGDLEQLFSKWDAIMLLAPAGERVAMAHMAILEVQRLLDVHAEDHDGLTINGEIVIPAADPKKPNTIMWDITDGGKAGDKHG